MKINKSVRFHISLTAFLVGQQIIAAFGTARLVKNSDGRHELIGGTADDYAAAHEWCSLFAPEIVFTSGAHLERLARPARTTIAFAA